MTRLSLQMLKDQKALPELLSYFIEQWGENGLPTVFEAVDLALDLGDAGWAQTFLFHGIERETYYAAVRRRPNKLLWAQVMRVMAERE